MKALLMILSYAGLALTIIPAILVFQGIISLETNKNLMLAGAVCWFLTAPRWMNKKEESDEEDREDVGISKANV